MAKRLIELGMSNEEICRVTELTKNEIEKLLK